ncbi:MAG TPA: PepSY domain-containing protein [Acetobacteraceae bacterium]|nr:PepSY domain-containing protein [Acetobacteraceae bacterium]
MRVSILLACLALVLAAPAALAEESCHSAGQPMTKAAMEKSLTARGYTRIRSLSLHNGCYEAKGFDSNGKRFELELDAATGAIHNAE